MSEVETASDKASTEGAKMMFESIKHLTTLSVGSILILIALLEKLFKNPHWRVLVAISFLTFTLSILASVRTMIFLSGHVGRRGESTKPGQPLFVAAIWTFWIAVLSLVWFGLKGWN